MILSKQWKLQVTIIKTNNFDLQGFKYSKQIQIIFKRIYFTYRCILKVAATPDQGGLGWYSNEKVLHISLELEPHHQVQFSIIPRTLLFLEVGDAFPFCWGYSQPIILTFIDKAEIDQNQIKLMLESFL